METVTSLDQVQVEVNQSQPRLEKLELSQVLFPHFEQRCTNIFFKQ